MLNKILFQKPQSLLGAGIYFSIFIGVIAGFSLAYIDFGGKFLKASNSANSSILQANLVYLLLENNKAEHENKPIALIFVGDIMLSRGVAQIIEKNNNYKFPFLKIADYLKSADFVLGNLEGPISDKGKNQGSIYSFRNALGVVEGLKFAGFGAMFLANNHIMDWGGEALNDTVLVLKANNIDMLGAGANYFEANNILLKNINGIKIAFLNFTNLYPKSLEAGVDYAGVSDFNIIEIKNNIKLIKELKVADVVVASFHWGTEYETRSNLEQRKIAHELADVGADLIVGHHPHVVQEIEQYGNSFIAYSLGNFVFDQNFSSETRNGLLLKVIIEDKKIRNIEPIKIKINDNFQPEIANY